jgi:hypothetical protein
MSAFFQKLARALQCSKCRNRNTLPVLGSLVQAGRGTLLYTGTRSTRRGLRSHTRFGDLGTGRPGIPSFIPPGG